MKQHHRHSRGFTLGELLVVIIVVVVLATILFPYPFGNFRRDKARQTSCLSNMKQMGIAFLMYAQDHDSKFPPVTGTIKLSDNKIYQRQWGVTTNVLISGTSTPVPGILSSFVKNQRIFECPSVPTPTSGLTYIYNDLAANESIGNIPQPGNSLLTADGDDHLGNVGHARSQTRQGNEAFFRLTPDTTGLTLLVGGAIGDAVLRHSDGANYGFADGHARWMKPDSVFFPARASSSSHREAATGKILGPDPAGATQNGMTFQGKVYKATFHVR